MHVSSSQMPHDGGAGPGDGMQVRLFPLLSKGTRGAALAMEFRPYGMEVADEASTEDRRVGCGPTYP